jgi:hypothetical protein
VRLFSDEPIVFVGPGSEWFWTALSGIVLAITFVAIYRQLRHQRSQSAFEQLNLIEMEWASERTTRHVLEVLSELVATGHATEVPTASARYIADFYERFGSLARAGFIAVHVLWSAWGPDCQLYWATLRPFVMRLRSDERTRTLYQNFEWLNDRLTEADRRAGNAITLDAALLRTEWDRIIDESRAVLQVEEAMRAAPTIPATPHPRAGRVAAIRTLAGIGAAPANRRPPG